MALPLFRGDLVVNVSTVTRVPPLRTRARRAVELACARAIANGTLPSVPDGVTLPDVEIERPAKPEHGDLATSVALKLARPYRQSPMVIASAIAAELRADAELPGDPSDARSTSPFSTIDIAPPGFINLVLADRALEETVDAVLAAPDTWGE